MGLVGPVDGSEGMGEVRVSAVRAPHRQLVTYDQVAALGAAGQVQHSEGAQHTEDERGQTRDGEYRYQYRGQDVDGHAFLRSGVTGNITS
jgi:hypothetical protein